LSHAWTAIARPWELSLKEHVDNIEEVSRRIDQLASSASKAELRATHLEVHQVRAELKDVKLQVDKACPNDTS
jgi:ppGpp synthetase/RelA/SpoT-type nucleotidyltranferase